jgi:hypothetical protein
VRSEETGREEKKSCYQIEEIESIAPQPGKKQFGKRKKIPAKMPSA